MACREELRPYFIANRPHISNSVCPSRWMSSSRIALLVGSASALNRSPIGHDHRQAGTCLSTEPGDPAPAPTSELHQNEHNGRPSDEQNERNDDRGQRAV